MAFCQQSVFNVCYSVINGSNDANEKLAEECETVHIEPLSPPQLVLPADNEQVTLTRPVYLVATGASAIGQSSII